jgi:hypothetical protein
LVVVAAAAVIVAVAAAHFHCFEKPQMSHNKIIGNTTLHAYVVST